MEIKNAILHIIKNDGSPSLYSESELDIDSEICEAFISKHVKKLRNNPATREATFRPDSALYTALQSYMARDTSFRDFSINMAERFGKILASHTEVPSADLLIIRFDIKQDQFLAIVKLNYNECFTHEAKGTATNLVKCQTVLPFSSGKVEEACLIPFSPMLIQLIEAHEYFSEEFLECDTSLSRKEQAQIINEITDEFVQEYYNSDIKTHALVKTAITEEAEEADGVLSMDNVAARAFSENTDARQNFVHTLRDAGIVEDMPMGAKFIKQQFGTQRIKTENGIEVKFPAELAVDGEQVEVEKHSDGSVTITLKRLWI